NLQILFNRPLPCLNPKVFFHPYFKEKKEPAHYPKKSCCQKFSLPFLSHCFLMKLDQKESWEKCGCCVDESRFVYFDHCARLHFEADWIF
ncbi:hypothetical protein, partial [Anaerostipes hadrus]|uniref:hypothetical protein n=1 Tax=Anaerostipes hadrus TaxID=649756 RepID=UPI001EDFCAAF